MDKQIDEQRKVPIRAIKEALARFRYVIAALLFVFAIALAWDAWSQGASGRNVGDLAAEAQTVQSASEKIIDGLVQNFDRSRNNPLVIAAAASGDTQDAAKAFASDWPEAAKVIFIAPNLKEAFADPKAFGYGRIAALDAGLNYGSATVTVARVDGHPQLLVTGPIKQSGEVVTLAMLPLPLETLKTAVKDVRAGPGYLALRFGDFDVGAVGDRELSLIGITERTPLREKGFQIVSASAQAAVSMFGMRPWLDYIFAVLFALAAVGLFLHGRNLAVKIGAAAALEGEKPSEETFASLIQAQPEPEKKAVVREPVKPPTIAMERSIFRAYDIRGIVGKTLDPNVARMIGQSIGSEMQDKGLKDIVVGRDGRESGSAMANALIEGLRAAGCDVIDIGEAPTPLTYFAAFQLRTGSCVSVTGSHNPPDHNGFKIVLGGETLSGDAIQSLYARISEDRLRKAAALGGLQQREVATDYISRIAEDIQIERKLKVVVDAGNGVAGMIAPEVLEAIGCEVVPLYCEVDGSFPNHHPDPSDPHNLADLIQMVQRLNADLGVAFDGDGDRLGVVTHSGEIIYPDRLLMLFAADVLERNPGACIVYDVKCTGHLAGHILRHGGSPLMWKTGHSLIKAKMKETGAELAGEMSGHFFFKERWYGFDDGIYAAARLLEILASLNESADTIFAGLPKGFSTPELKVDMPEGAAYGFIDKFREQAKFVGARIVTIDGVRADWLDGWGLVRASNTTSVLVMRFDADTQAALERIQGVFREQLLAVKPDLVLPF